MTQLATAREAILGEPPSLHATDTHYQMMAQYLLSKKFPKLADDTIMDVIRKMRANANLLMVVETTSPSALAVMYGEVLLAGLGNNIFSVAHLPEWTKDVLSKAIDRVGKSKTRTGWQEYIKAYLAGEYGAWPVKAAPVAPIKKMPAAAAVAEEGPIAVDAIGLVMSTFSRPAVEPSEADMAWAWKTSKDTAAKPWDTMRAFVILAEAGRVMAAAS